VPRHASHVLASWPAWCRRLAFARGRRAHNSRATPNGRSRGRCAPTAACKCAAASNPRKREPRSSPDRGTRALRASSHRRARTPDSLRVVCLPSVPQSTPEGAERRRTASLSCRSSSTTMFESGAARPRWSQGTGSAGSTRCPRGSQERPRRPRSGGSGSGGGFRGVASRRRLARWGALGAWASGRATRRPSGAAHGLRGVTWGFAAFCSVFVF
jgi:hypothetical protein